MRVAILTVQVPFISGGAEILATSLCAELRKRGYEADIISIPFKWYPPERILDCMLTARLVDVEEVNGQKIDRVIALKFPAYFIPHANKVGWLLHQHRQAYDLYETPYGDLHQTADGRRVAQEIRRWDNHFLRSFPKIFTISNTVTQRLQTSTHIRAKTLYPPPGNHEQFYCDDFGNYILYPGRFDAIKRQHLIVEAMQYVPSELKLVLIGPYDNSYGHMIRKRIADLGLSDRITVVGPVSEQQKAKMYAECLAVYNGVYNEDYGYVTLEAFLSHKPVITHPDSGGPLEFVQHESNGYIVAPDPEEIGRWLTRLASNRHLAKTLGEGGKQTIVEKQISWDHVVARLVS